MVISRGEPRTQEYHDRNDIRKHTYDDKERLYRLLGKATFEAEKARESVKDLIQENKFLRQLLDSGSKVDGRVHCYPGLKKSRDAAGKGDILSCEDIQDECCENSQVENKNLQASSESDQFKGYRCQKFSYAEICMKKTKRVW